MQVSKFNELADKKEFIVIYPNGAYGFMGMFQHWNAGHCCGKAQKDNTDDVGFIDKALESAKNRYQLNFDKIHLVGFSNGGMLAYRYAAEKSSKVSGLAVIAGAIGGRAGPDDDYWQIPAPKSAMPVMIYHGKKDDSVPFTGGKTQRHKTQREYSSVLQAADFWKQHGSKVKLVVDEKGGHTWPGISTAEEIYEFFRAEDKTKATSTPE